MFNCQLLKVVSHSILIVVSWGRRNQAIQQLLRLYSAL